MSKPTNGHLFVIPEILTSTYVILHLSGGALLLRRLHDFFVQCPIDDDTVTVQPILAITVKVDRLSTRIKSSSNRLVMRYAIAKYVTPEGYPRNHSSKIHTSNIDRPSQSSSSRTATLPSLTLSSPVVTSARPTTPYPSDSCGA